MFLKKKTEEVIDTIHLFQEKENRFPLDILLRKHGYRIYSRKNNESPIWIKDKKLFHQEKALNRIYRKNQEMIGRVSNP